MRTLGIFVAAGALTWVLRASFIFAMRSTESAARAAALVRHAGPAALAALVTASLVSTNPSRGPTWRLLVAAVVAMLVARRFRNLTAVIGAGTLTVAVLSLA